MCAGNFAISDEKESEGLESGKVREPLRFSFKDDIIIIIIIIEVKLDNKHRYDHVPKTLKKS
jgi:hypothetical protein